jgi:hypothetical protein
LKPIIGVTDPTPESNDSPSHGRPTRWQRISAFAFIGAFGLTILTVILTGLEVRSPASRRAPETPVVTVAASEPHVVNLLFNSLTQVDGVRFTVDLPTGIELNGRAGVRRIEWTAPLAAGNNLLPLEIVARAGSGGQLAARLQHGSALKTFVVDIAVGAR